MRLDVALGGIEQVHAERHVVRPGAQVIHALARRVAEDDFGRVRIQGEWPRRAVGQRDLRFFHRFGEREAERIAGLDEKLAGFRRGGIEPFDGVGDEDGERNAQRPVALEDIEADPDLLPRVKTVVKDSELMIRITGSWSDLIKEALTTSLNRQRIKYTLTVKQLTAMDIDGITHLEAANLETDRLAFRFRGPGRANIAWLHARLFEVDISGPCKIEVTGKVVEQSITVSAIGFYYAPKLESKKAVARLNGPSQATIWVCNALDATISGPGRLEYYGSPRVRQKGFPFGGLVSLGKP